ncbi:MAG: hypothetical protein JO222_09605 [Frankiales bacterium]|nr:hypothetical protein [Frankiales bacterium]
MLGLSVGDRYPVITAQAAFDRLQSQPIAMPEICMLRKDGKPGCASIPRPRITGAHLGLMPDVDGTRPVLVPAWLFTVAGSADPIAQLAIEPSFLAAPPTPRPLPLNGGGVAPGPPVTAAPMSPR